MSPLDNLSPTWWESIPELLKLALAGVAGGSVWKGIDSMSGALKARGDHRLSLIDQLDKLRREAMEEREKAFDELSIERAERKILEGRLKDTEVKISDLNQRLADSQRAESDCQRRLTELSSNIDHRLELGNSKFSELDHRLQLLENSGKD